MIRFFSLLRVAGLATVVMVAFAPRALAFPREVVVTLFQKRPLQCIWVRDAVEMIRPDGRRVDLNSVFLRSVDNTIRVYSGVRPGDEIKNAPVFTAESIVFRGTNGLTALELSSRTSHYKGTISVHVDHRMLVITNKVNARDYVKIVVGSETEPNFPLEELKAQSVMAQTLVARYKRGDYLPDTTEKEAYLGWDHVTDAVAKAVDETWGQTLTFNNQPATLYFHSTCAGGTSDGAKYFQLKNTSIPYLRGRKCDFCKPSPFWKEHMAVIPKDLWEKAVGTGPATIETVDERQRPLSVRLSNRKVGGYELWMEIGQKLGWDKAPGTRYKIENTPDATILRSTGAGHGVGLCQWGARVQAQAGKTYRQILEFYFPGTSLKTAAVTKPD
jgi:stage II sporulation protein D